MKPHKHRTTLSTISLAFAGVGIIMLIYSFGFGPNEGRTAFQSRLNEPLLQKSTASSVQLVRYMQRNTNIPNPQLTAASSLVWDSASSTPLWNQNIDEKRPIASITKLITATVVLENTTLEEEVIVSEEAVSTEGHAGLLMAGERLNVATLLQAMLLESSNDAAAALAEHVENKTGTNFVRLMNSRADAMGMHNSEFRDPAGLVDEGAYSTARDLVTLLEQLRTTDQYETVWDILHESKLTAFSLDGTVVHTFESTNPFLEELGGVLGGKTGYTQAAGESMVLVVSAPDESRELYYIVLGSEDRFADIRTLINWVGSAYVWSGGE